MTIAATVVPTGSREYNEIASLLPKCCVTEIRSIENGTQGPFEIRSKGKKTQRMFHGTKKHSVIPIIKEGLKTDANVTSAYGRGTYFSPDPMFSLKGYTDGSRDELSYVFLCDIIMDETKKGTEFIYVCPRDESHCLRYLIVFYKQAE